jgi:hypothetical protein
MIETHLLRPVLLAVLLSVALGSSSGRADPGFSKGPSEELSHPLPKRPRHVAPRHAVPPEGTATPAPDTRRDGQTPVAAPSQP